MTVSSHIVEFSFYRHSESIIFRVFYLYQLNSSRIMSVYNACSSDTPLLANFVAVTQSFHVSLWPCCQVGYILQFSHGKLQTNRHRAEMKRIEENKVPDCSDTDNAELSLLNRKKIQER